MYRILTSQVAWQTELDRLAPFEFTYFSNCTNPDQLSKQCNINNIDTVLHFDYVTISILVAEDASANVIKDIPGLFPSAEVSIMEDKWVAYNWFNSHGYQAYLPKSKQPDDFPFVLKKPCSRGGEQVFLVNNKKEMDAIKGNLEKIIIQDYIASDYEYVYHFLALEGKVVIERCYQHDFREISKQNGNYTRGKGCHNQNIKKYNLPKKHLDIFSSIIKELNFVGFGCFDFKLKDGSLYIIELNTRMGGSLVFYNDKMNDFESFMTAYMDLISGH